MSRLNLTLDDDTSKALARHAERERRPRATVARELLCEAIREREAAERRRRLARDYAAGRADVAALLSDLEEAQLELLDDA
jgi:hypothetical protein